MNSCLPKRVFRLGLIVGAIATAAALAGASPPVINEWCPVLTDQKADPGITAVYKGKTVAFCCDHCLAKFEADPEKYLGRLPQFADSPPAEVSSTLDNASSAINAGDSSDEHAGAEMRSEAGRHGQEHDWQTQEDRGVPWLARVHPAIVHFPLASMPVALLGFLAWVITKHDAFAKADAVPLFVASVAAIAAVITGNIAHDAMRFSGELHRIVERHETAATVVMVLAICLSILRIWRWNRLAGPWRWGYGIGLLLACGLLAITGFLGGSLVFGPDHFRF